MNFTKIYNACALNFDTYFYSPLKIDDIVSSTKFITDSLRLAFVAFNLDLFNDFRLDKGTELRILPMFVGVKRSEGKREDYLDSKIFEKV